MIPVNRIRLLLMFVTFKVTGTQRCDNVIPTRRIFNSCSNEDDSYIDSNGQYSIREAKGTSDCVCLLVVPLGLVLAVDPKSCLEITCATKRGAVVGTMPSGSGGPSQAPLCRSGYFVRLSQKPQCSLDCLSTTFWFEGTPPASQASVRVTCGSSTTRLPPSEIKPRIMCLPNYEKTLIHLAIPSSPEVCGSNEDDSEEDDDAMSGPYAMLPGYNTHISNCNCHLEVPSGVKLWLHTPGSCVQVECVPYTLCEHEYRRGVYEIKASGTTWYNVSFFSEACSPETNCKSTYLMIKAPKYLDEVTVKFACGIQGTQERSATEPVKQTTALPDHSRSTTDGLIIGLVLGVLLAFLIGMVIGGCFHEKLKRCFRQNQSESPLRVPTKSSLVNIPQFDALAAPLSNANTTNIRTNPEESAGRTNYTYIEFVDTNEADSNNRQAIRRTSESGYGGDRLVMTSSNSADIDPQKVDHEDVNKHHLKARIKSSLPPIPVNEDSLADGPSDGAVAAAAEPARCPPIDHTEDQDLHSSVPTLELDPMLANPNYESFESGQERLY